MPKAVSCNSFYMFMIETRKRLEARGERFPRGNEDVVHVAAEIWETMTPEQKLVYKEKAKDYKRSDEYSAHKKEVRGRLPRSLREAGGAGPSRRRAAERVDEEEFVEPVPYIYPSEDEEAIEEFRKKHVKDRAEIYESWRWNLAENADGIQDMKCYLISFIPHCRTSGYEFYPAEVAVVEFSLRAGVTKSISRVLGPHPDLRANLVPIATENVRSHKIPFDSSIDGMTNDYVRVMEEILRFCRPSKNLRRLFCLSKEFNCVQGCIKFLQCEAKVLEIRADRINCVDDLFQLFCQWRDKACAPAEWRIFNECDGISPTAPFFQHPGLLCEYHAKENVHRCALGTAKRAAFYLLQRIQSHYPLHLTDKHIPPPMTAEAQAAAAVAATAAAACKAEQSMAAAASSGHWQVTRAALQHQAERHDDDRMSTMSGTTGVTQRTVVYEEPDLDDVPQNLPLGLRQLAGTGAAPDCWQEPEMETGQIGHSLAGPTQPYPESAPAPSVRSVTTARTAEFQGNVTSVDWNQNRDVRDGCLVRTDRGRRVDYPTANRNMNGNMDGAARGNQNGQGGASYAAAATSRQVRPTMQRPQSGGAATSAGMGNLTSEFGNMRFQQPVVLPSPQNIPPIGSTRTGLSGPRPRSTMTPRIALPPNMVNNGAANATRPRMGGPPVRTQSRVKQMLADRLRHTTPSANE